MTQLTKERIKEAIAAAEWTNDLTSYGDTVRAALKLAEKVLGEPSTGMRKAASKESSRFIHRCAPNTVIYKAMRDQMLREIERGD